jgi:hypothetical protein
MCRLVIWAKVRLPVLDIRREAGRFQPGMVVSVLPDGQHPGLDFDRLKWWSIVDIPGVSVEEMEYLTHHMPEDIDKSKLPRIRWRFLDKDQINITGGVTIQVNRNQIARFEKVMDYLIDNTILGEDPQVIG